MRGKNTAVALVFPFAVAFFHQHGKAVAFLQIADKVDFRPEKFGQLQGHLRAFAHIGHRLEEIVADGGFHRAEQGDVLNGLHPGHRFLDAFHHQAAAVVDFILKALDPARSRIRDDGVRLALTEGAHGKNLPGRADVLIDAFATRPFQDFADGVAFFHSTFDHFLAGSRPVGLFLCACGRGGLVRRGKNQRRVRRQSRLRRTVAGNRAGRVSGGTWHRLRKANPGVIFDGYGLRRAPGFSGSGGLRQRRRNIRKCRKRGVRRS